MFDKKYIFIGLLSIVICGSLAKAEAAPTAALSQVIEAAKKEGALNVVLRSGFNQKSMDRLRKEIREKFGVDLDIKFTPGGSMPKHLSNAIMEHKLGAVPTFDLMNFSNHIVEGYEAGVFERVDWKQLLLEGTPLEVVMDLPETRGSIIYFTGHQGVIYNSQKVPADKTPRALKDLADPKWKGKVGVFEYPNSWSTWGAYLGDKEQVLPELRGIMKNGAIVGTYVDLYNRFLLGEIAFNLTNSVYLKMAKDKGMPAAWQSMEISYVENFSLSVRKGAKHPNAAKLVSLYLASPQGAKFTLEESGAGNIYYPGNYEHDIAMQDKRQGIREVFPEKDLKIIKFGRSEESRRLEKEVQLILAGATR